MLGTAPVHTAIRQYETSLPSEVTTTCRTGSILLHPVEARPHRQVLEDRRKPQFAELRSLRANRDEVEFRERLLAGIGLDEQDLDVFAATTAQCSTQPNRQRGSGVAAADDHHTSDGVVRVPAGIP